MILFTWSQRKIKLSLGLPESCTASLLCKLVLDLQIKVSDHLGCQGSSSWEIETAYIYLRLLWLYKISIYSYKTGSQQFWSDFFGAGEEGYNPSIYQFYVDTYDYTFCMMKSNPVWLPHLYPAIVPKSFFKCCMLSSSTYMWLTELIHPILCIKIHQIHQGFPCFILFLT